MQPATDVSQADVPSRIARLLRAAPPGVLLSPTPVAAPRAVPRAAAVDGSSAMILEGRAVSVGAYRAATVRLEGGRATGAARPPPRLALLEAGACGEAVAAEARAAGWPAPERRDLSPEAALDRLRSLDEALAAAREIETLGEGDVLLLDGPLRFRDTVPPRALLVRLLDEAAARGVVVAGVSKGTSLVVAGGVPALVAADRAARAARLATWFARIPDGAGVAGTSWAAKLSAAEPRVFRFDLAPRCDPAEAFARIASLCGHPAYPGYPSPLAMAHHAALLDEPQQRELVRTLRVAVEDLGVDGEAWDLVFGDYHDVLELGA